MHIRSATPNDAAAVAKLLTQLGYATSESDIAEHTLRAPSNGPATVLLAEDGDRVIGLATVHILSVLNRRRDVAWLTALVVDETVRQSGVGRALVDAVEKFAHAAGCERLSVTTHEDREGAKAFYPKIGFELTGRRFGKVLAP